MNSLLGDVHRLPFVGRGGGRERWTNVPARRDRRGPDLPRQVMFTVNEASPRFRSFYNEVVNANMTRNQFEFTVVQVYPRPTKLYRVIIFVAHVEGGKELHVTLIHLDTGEQVRGETRQLASEETQQAFRDACARRFGVASGAAGPVRRVSIMNEESPFRTDAAWNAGGGGGFVPMLSGGRILLRPGVNMHSEVELGDEEAYETFYAHVKYGLPCRAAVGEKKSEGYRFHVIFQPRTDDGRNKGNPVRVTLSIVTAIDARNTLFGPHLLIKYGAVLDDHEHGGVIPPGRVVTREHIEEMFFYVIGGIMALHRQREWKHYSIERDVGLEAQLIEEGKLVPTESAYGDGGSADSPFLMSDTLLPAKDVNKKPTNAVLFILSKDRKYVYMVERNWSWGQSGVTPYYGLPGGRIDAEDRSPIEAAAREFLEETNRISKSHIKALRRQGRKIHRSPPFVDLPFDPKETNHMNYNGHTEIIIVRATGKHPLLSDTTFRGNKETDGARWVSLDDLRNGRVLVRKEELGSLRELIGSGVKSI